MPVDMPRLMKIANKHNLFVIEDCALAIGSMIDGKHAGLFGDTGCFSFYPVKHMTTAEGGMLITENEEIANSIKRKKAFGVDRTVSERKIPGIYDVTLLGFNYRLNEIQSAIGIEQIKKLPDFLAVRKANFSLLADSLSSIDEITLLQSSTERLISSHYCLSVILDDNIAKKRFEIVNSLNTSGVGTSIYYPHPVPELTYYKEKYGLNHSNYPMAKRISDNSIALPVGPHLTSEDILVIANELKKAIHFHR